MESSVKTIINVSKEKRPDHFFSDFNMSFFDKTRSFYSVTLHINRSKTVQKPLKLLRVKNFNV